MAERDRIDDMLLAASKFGGRLFRNNSGVAFHKDGSAVRYGVGLGGSDCIGWFPVKRRDEIFAVFTAVEIKDERHKPSPEQDRFLRNVNMSGGIGVWGHDIQAIVAEIMGRAK